MTTVPTSLRGYTTDSTYYDGILTDVLEHIPDLMYPLSVPVYGRMRNEGAIAAVLAAYTLPIRRATWTVNPSGCRPEVAKLVADDLGLPVAGKDEPGAARTRGVSWSEHLRCALNYLTFGHAAFELQAEMRDGQARLVALHERLQSTIQEIHVDRQGQLLGISQELLTRKSRPQIPADRLCFYSHDREGANWAGRALIRPAYPFWLIKQEMIRTHSIANRRWGAGVPVMEALPGTNPSPGQMAEAMQMAAAARAGEQAGAATPPGFVMKILGLSGAVPDTLGFLRWLDQQISRFALAGFLDLGSSETGSRALGQSFIDLFLLNTSTIGLAAADTVTRQVAAKVVEWNYGTDEPVPAIEVNDIGTKHDITAEALNLLLNSGALSSDPALESHVRRMFKLPERAEQDGNPAPSGRIFEHDVTSGVITRNERRAQIGLPPIEGGDTLVDPDAPKPTPPVVEQPKVAAKRNRQADGQLALPIAAAAADDEADRVQRDYDAALAALLAAWPVLSAPLVADLAAQAAAAGTAGLASLAASVDSVNSLTVAIADAMARLAAQAADQVAASARAQGVDIPPVPVDEGRLAEVAAVTAALLASRYATAAADRALSVPVAGVATAVSTALSDLSTATRGMVADRLGAALSTAQGAGRAAVMAASPPRMLVADESNDSGSRCEACTQVAGRTYPTLAAAVEDYPTLSGYSRCAGGSRCYGFIRAVWR
jgi:hypothetical protein